jgi:heme exporter protein C
MHAGKSGAGWVAPVAVAAALALAVAQWFIFVYAPVEATMGVVQKIFYPHLGLAWWGMFSFFTVFVAGILYLWRREARFDRLAGPRRVGGSSPAWRWCAAPCGRAHLERGWTWDPRLTTALIMCFIYAPTWSARLGLGRERRALVCAVVGVAAFLDVPLVFISARMWRSIHPAVFKREGGGLEPEMLTALFVTLFAFGLLWLCLVALRARQLAAAERGSALAAGRIGL